MTLAEYIGTQSRPGGGAKQAEQQPEKNVGNTERLISLTAGAVLIGLGLSRKSVSGLVVAGVGAAVAKRGATGSCDLYHKLGINTAKTGEHDVEKEVNERGIHIEQAFLINKPAETLYQFWRDFSNLPKVMKHLKSVEDKGGGKSHWVADAPALVGGHMEWDAEITGDQPNERIAWRSLAGSDIDCTGEVKFRKALGDRGTEVRVSMSYVPPAGKVGNWIATLFGKAPKAEIREGLRDFKRLMETGEVPTTQGQSRGTCLGQGKYEGE